LYRFAVVAAKELLDLDFSNLMLIDNDKNGLTLVDTIGFPESFVGQFTLLQGQGLSTYVVQNKKPETVVDFAREDRFEIPGTVQKHNIHSAICVPMMLEGEVFGALIGHTVEKREFSQEELSLYQSIGNHTATAIKNALNLEALKKEGKKLHDITSHIAEGLHVINRTGQVTYLNEEAERLLGWSQAELNEKNVHDLVHYRKADGSPLPFEDCGIHNVVHTGKSYVSSDEVFIRRDGTVFPVSIVASPILDKGQVVGSVTSFRDISKVKQIEQEREKLIVELQEAEIALRRLSVTDVLTGLSNRRAFNELLDEEWRRALRMDYQLVMLMLDVDFFKKYNDTYGHLQGDECLKSVAAVLKNVTRRPGDVVARFGGEEFVILLSMSDTDHAVAVAEKICLDIEALKLPHKRSGLSDYVTISIGVASAMPTNLDISSQNLIQYADDALYKAKQGGRNRVAVNR
jgi:diguanylate cyclase (GGDEF)-like protein/PAS domain S-box-containing protein